MVAPRRPGDRAPADGALTTLSAALKAMPVDTGRAWGQVWARVAASQPLRPRPRWPLAASLSLVIAFLVLAHTGGWFDAGPIPPLAAIDGAATRIILNTPALRAQTALGAAHATSAPAPQITPTPVPLPPGQG